jgi:hypothetical protein
MRKLKGLWAPLLLGMLLMATLVGVASARPNARPLGQAWRVLTVNTQACTPDDEGNDFQHWWHALECDAGTCQFVCPVYFPAAGEQAVGAVNVKRFTLYALDNYFGKSVQAWLYKTYPPNKAYAQMASVDTATVATDPQTVIDTSIDNNPVYRTQGPYIWLNVGGTFLKAYGFFIHYTW